MWLRTVYAVQCFVTLEYLHAANELTQQELLVLLVVVELHNTFCSPLRVKNAFGVCACVKHRGKPEGFLSQRVYIWLIGNSEVWMWACEIVIWRPGCVPTLGLCDCSYSWWMNTVGGGKDCDLSCKDRKRMWTTDIGISLSAPPSPRLAQAILCVMPSEAISCLAQGDFGIRGGQVIVATSQ